MANRHPMAASIVTALGPETKVIHKVGYPLTAVTEIGGVKGKREIGPFMFCCPAPVSGACCSPDATGKNVKALSEKVASGAPSSTEMER